MNNMNDELFDSKIKKRIKNEINCIPDDINEKIDETFIKIRKRKGNLKKVCSICVVCIIGTILFGLTMPTYASNIPIIGNIFEMFNYKTFENYDKYASDLNITKESNGLKMTINKVVYDEIDLSIFYTVESENKLEESPMFPGAKLKINGKETTFGAGGQGEFFNDNKTYAGVIEYKVGEKKQVPKEVQNKIFLGGYVEIPDKFILSLNIDEILSSGDNVIKGNWNFNIPVTSEKVSGKVNEQNCDIDLSNLVDGYHINQVITTPLNTLIQGTITGQPNYNYELSFYVFDDKGRMLPSKSGSGSGDEGIIYISNGFKEVYDDTDSITVIPYKHIQTQGNEDNPKEYITAKLNLQEETKLCSSNGEEYAVITKIITENGKTKIYYKSKYGIDVYPIEIIDNKTNEKILSDEECNDIKNRQENIAYLKDSDEYVITCNKELNKEDILVKCEDMSKKVEVYNDSKFTIKIK